MAGWLHRWCKYPSVCRFWLWHCLSQLNTPVPLCLLHLHEIVHWNYKVTNSVSPSFSRRARDSRSITDYFCLSEGVFKELLYGVHFPVSDLTHHATLRQSCVLSKPQKWKIVSYSNLDSPQKRRLIPIGYMLAQFQAAGLAQSNLFFFDRFWPSFVLVHKNCLYYPENKSSGIEPSLTWSGGNIKKFILLRNLINLCSQRSSQKLCWKAFEKGKEASKVLLLTDHCMAIAYCDSLEVLSKSAMCNSCTRVLRYRIS